jgi:hypothetical protein
MVSVEVLESQIEVFRLELAKRDMQLILYRQCLLDNDIIPPDSHGEDLLQMYNECRKVISTANQFVMRLGTSKELLMDWHDIS